jgi:hypothetical protein
MAYKIAEKNESFDFESAVSFKDLNGVNMVNMGHILYISLMYQTRINGEAIQLTSQN